MGRSRTAAAVVALLAGAGAACAAEPSQEDYAADNPGRSDLVDDMRPSPPRIAPVSGTGGVRSAPAEIEVDCANATYAIATGTGLGRCTVISDPHDRVFAGWCGDSNSNVSTVDCTRGCGSSQGKGTCTQKAQATGTD
jgi:hypothetical protein